MDAIERIYQAGRTAYAEGRSRDACPHGHTDLLSRHWWLAGWHDADFEANA